MFASNVYKSTQRTSLVYVLKQLTTEAIIALSKYDDF